jgi:hypothetical protein
LNVNERNLKICQVTTKVIGKCLSKYVQLLREQDFQIICFSFVRSYLSINIVSDRRQEEEEAGKRHMSTRFVNLEAFGPAHNGYLTNK